MNFKLANMIRAEIDKAKLKEDPKKTTYEEHVQNQGYIGGLEAALDMVKLGDEKLLQTESENWCAIMDEHDLDSIFDYGFYQGLKKGADLYSSLSE